MSPSASPFTARAAAALADRRLQRALADVPGGFVAARAKARAALPEFEALRRIGRDIKDHTLAHLDLYLEEFERNASAAGSHVHWAATAAEACETVLAICRAANARLIAKSKSMVSEEIGLNARLKASALEVVETDLGEYVIQLRGETPSHLIAPAIHLGPSDIAEDFRRRHHDLPPDRDMTSPAALVAEARGVLRPKFLAADVGLTGANLLVAGTGSAIIVTNEGNADLTLTLPRVHIVLASIEKVVPTLDDAWALLRLLARSGTGQEFTAYTTVVTGPKRAGDADGPEECHIVLVDNGRSEILGSGMREVLRCIRCGACMNHCPVYCSVGGHAYGTIYAGPIGAVLSPALVGGRETSGLPEEAAELAQVSTFCGRCEEVCPVEIPLVALMRRWRELSSYQRGRWPARVLLRTWAYLARRPRLYHPAARTGAALLAALARGRGAFRSLPFAKAWTRYRDLPAPQGKTFQALWARRQRQGAA